MKARVLMFGLLVSALALTGLAAAETELGFNFSDVVVPGAVQTDSYGINDHAQIAGDYIDANGDVHGMILKGTDLTTFDAPNGNTTQGFGINNHGVVVGWYVNNNGVIVGFRYKNGKFNDINFPGSVETEATGINDAGTIVGLYIDANGVQHGFKKRGNKYKTIDIKGAFAVTAWGINNDDTVTVYAADENSVNTSYALHYKGKRRVHVEVPGDADPGTVIHTPNNNGDIDMTWFDSSGGGHGAILRSNGKYVTFDDPDANNSTRADGLNVKLVVVGRYLHNDGTTRGFKAVPK